MSGQPDVPRRPRRQAGPADDDARARSGPQPPIRHPRRHVGHGRAGSWGAMMAAPRVPAFAAAQCAGPLDGAAPGQAFFAQVLHQPSAATVWLAKIGQGPLTEPDGPW